MKHELSIAFQTDKKASDYIALAQLVNEYAFDVVSVYCDAPFHPSYGPLLLMAPYIQHARAGAAAISPSRIHPIDIASQTALLEDVSNNGVYLGLARGAWLQDHGIQELRPAITTIRETIEIVTKLLRGESAEYAGKVFTIAEHVQATYPIPQELPPILIGTWGKRLCALAGELADEVKVGGSANPDLVPIIQAYIAVGEQKVSREVESVGVVMGAVTVVDDDREHARRMAKRAVALYLPVVASLDTTLDISPELIVRIRDFVNQHDYESAVQNISDELLERFAFAGTSDDIIRQCEALFSAGARRIEFGTPHGIDSIKGIKLLGETVLPALSDWC